MTTKVKPKVNTPVVTESLLSYLQTLYPDKSPDLETTIDVIRYNSGQVSVVRHLKKLYEDQSKNLLGSV